MKAILPFSLLLLFFTSCKTATEQKTIHVTGQGKIKVVPDMVELSLRAYAVNPAMKDAVTETQAAVNEIIAVCRRYVVNPSDIKVSSISTNKAYEYRNGKDQFMGYDALQVLDVTLKDISKIEQFTEELLATRISKIENIRYNHTKADSILREVNLMALEDARKTAEKMCGKMNASLGEIVYLSNFEKGQEGSGRGMRYSGAEYNVNLYNKSFGGNGFKMTAEILEFEDAAYASFTIR
ncbi:MAG: SIMPL domain-containing protein [Bacteroidota bacterium]|nr:SIMPL domain-containing protein [Bacteroidota bacterium]